MKEFVIAIILLVASSCYSYAIDGHNGIKFNMTQKQLEKMGFICNPNTDAKQLFIADCRHMDMTGVAFNIPAQNYSVSIGKNKRVATILADLIGIRTLDDYIALIVNISEFFPKKDEAGTKSIEGYLQRDAWRAKNNAGIALNFFTRSGPRVTIGFFSPTYMSALDKELAKEATKEK